jgi:hypothetical protein
MIPSEISAAMTAPIISDLCAEGDIPYLTLPLRRLPARPPPLRSDGPI